MKGAKPIPAEIRKVMGNPSRRPIRKSAPKAGKLGNPPACLNDAAREKWSEVSAQWQIVLARQDRDLVQLYCEAWAEMTNAQKRVDEDGAMIKTPNGMVQKSPWLTKVEQCREFCRKALAEFGGSPSARMRLTVDHEPEDDPADKFLN